MPELWEVAVVQKPRARTRPVEVLASVPAIIAGPGERAAWRFLEFFRLTSETRTPGVPMLGPSEGSANGWTLTP